MLKKIKVRSLKPIKDIATILGNINKDIIKLLNKTKLDINTKTL